MDNTNTASRLAGEYLAYTQTAGTGHRYACESGAYRNQRKGIACTQIFPLYRGYFKKGSFMQRKCNSGLYG